MTVTILDPSGQTATANSTAIIASYISATGTSFIASVGQTFTRRSPISPTPTERNSKNITALINWGDGQSSLGQISSTGAADSYTVTGTHTYATAGTSGLLSITVTIADPSGQTAVANSTALVSTPTIVATGRTFARPRAVVHHDGRDLHRLQSRRRHQPAHGRDHLGRRTDQHRDGHRQRGHLHGHRHAHLFRPGADGSYTIPSPSSTQRTDRHSQQHRPVVSSLSATGLTFSTTSGVPFSGTVAIPHGHQPRLRMPATSTVVINWGDGQTSPGVVSSTGSAGTFAVTGTHTYLTAGIATTYPVTVTIVDPSGQMATANSTAIVGNPGAATLTGGLTNLITNGPHSAAGFTNTNRPTFSGTTSPFAIVQLYARHFNVDAELPLGEAVANGSGQWTLTTGPLAVGTYIVTATVTLPGSYPSGAFTLKNQNGTDLVYIDLTPRLVRWLSHGQKSIPHTKVHVPHPKATKPQWVGHRRR